MNDDLHQRLMFAVDAARASSRITLDYFGRRATLDEEAKPDGTPVTIADRQSEADLRERIKNAYPDDSILGEEFGHKVGPSDYQWVIDPIDGTISFIYGVPLYGTMLACMHNGHPLIGVIVMPALDETVYAADGLGCWHQRGSEDPVAGRVSRTGLLKDALVNTTSMNYFRTPAHRRLYDRLDAESKHSRGWSDCYGWVLLATGRVDAVVEPVLSLWDFAAAIPIVSEAGGQWADFRGQRALESGEMVAANPALLDQLLDLIRDTSDPA